VSMGYVSQRTYNVGHDRQMHRVKSVATRTARFSNPEQSYADNLLLHIIAPARRTNRLYMIMLRGKYLFPDAGHCIWQASSGSTPLHPETAYI
jgi:hypothetical protein